MNKNNQIDVTYDPNITPYYEGTTKLDNKSVLVYNMDEHQNKNQLSKISHIVEFYTVKSECIVTPKLIIDNLFLTDDETIIDYFNIQVKLRKGVIRTKQFTYIMGIILLTYLIGKTIQYIQVDTWLNFTIIGGLLLCIVFGLFFSQARLLKKQYANFTKQLVDKFTRDVVIEKFQTIIDNVDEIDYFEEFQKTNTKNHYASLIEIIKNKGL